MNYMATNSSTRTGRHQTFENTTLEEKFGNFPETTIDLGIITDTNTHLSVRLKKEFQEKKLFKM